MFTLCDFGVRGLAPHPSRVMVKTRPSGWTELALPAGRSRGQPAGFSSELFKASGRGSLVLTH